MVNDVIKDLNGSLDGAIEAMKRELSRVRTGRANLSLLDGIKVEYYGTPTQLGHVASLQVPDPRLIVINEATWQALGAKERQALKTAIDANALIQDNEILSQEAKLVDTFKAGGMTVIQPDVESFRKPVLASLPAKFEGKWGKGLWERIATS